jgi:hypothetical protein
VVVEVNRADCLSSEETPHLILLQGGDSENLADLQVCYPRHEIKRYRLPNGFIVVALYTD